MTTRGARRPIIGIAFMVLWKKRECGTEALVVVHPLVEIYEDKIMK